MELVSWFVAAERMAAVGAAIALAARAGFAIGRLPSSMPRSAFLGRFRRPAPVPGRQSREHTVGPCRRPECQTGPRLVPTSASHEAVAYLTSMGFHKREADALLAQVPTGLDVEQTVLAALATYQADKDRREAEAMERMKRMRAEEKTMALPVIETA